MLSCMYTRSPFLLIIVKNYFPIILAYTKCQLYYSDAHGSFLGGQYYLANFTLPPFYTRWIVALMTAIALTPVFLDCFITVLPSSSPRLTGLFL